MANKKNEQIVVFDTTVLSHFLFTRERELAEHEVATALVNDLYKNNFTLAIPAPCLLEILVAYPEEDRRLSIYEKLSKNFKIYSFNSRAAHIGATLVGTNFYKDFVSEISGEKNPDTLIRDHIRTDLQIVSIAVSIEAECIYSTDSHFLPIAGDRIKIRNYSGFSFQHEIDYESRQ